MRIYVTAIVASLIAHWALLGGLSRAAREAPKPARPLEIAVIRPALAPPPEPPAAVPEPKAEKAKRPPPPVDARRVAPPPEQTPPSTNQEPSPEPAAPVFGISMSSTVSGNSGFSVRVGNTTMKQPDAQRVRPQDVTPYTSAEKFVPVYALSAPPSQVGDCREPYPEAARAAHVQGRIKLDVLVRGDGSVGEVTPLNKLGYGLEETAVRALKRCRFKAGHDGTQAVATRITYTYTFAYEDLE